MGDIEQDDTVFSVRATKPCKHGYGHCIAEMELQLQFEAMASMEEFKTRAAEVDKMGSRTNTGSRYRIRMQEPKGKRPFLSHIDYLGMGPSYMRPGDMIVVLCGASVPFIVRPITVGRFRFLGECYCDGIMDGEITKRVEKEGIILV